MKSNLEEGKSQNESVRLVKLNNAAMPTFDDTIGCEGGRVRQKRYVDSPKYKLNIVDR